MESLTVELGDRSYPIHIGPGLIGRGDLIVPHLAQPRVAIVTDTHVAPLHLAPLRTALAGGGVDTVEIVIPAGEEQKSWITLDAVFDQLLAHRCERRTTLIALGGGVVGDLTGFAAATYQRGVPFIQIPTTLLAQVDSSVGGKTAINHSRGKNMVGAFYQPKVVIADTDTLATLPPREFAAGMAEVIKYGFISDRPFLEWLEANMARLMAQDPEALTHAIRRSCEDKATVVAADEREETGARALLNLGHTFETGLGYGTWLHGEAVAAGMVLAARVAREMGLLAPADVARATELLRRAALPVDAPDLGVSRYLDLMGLDKKVEGGRIRFVLMRALGEAFVTADVPPAVLERVLAAPAADA
jgi:3-dehydroquinate synthase